MPIHRSTVETWMDRYCAPGTHRFPRIAASGRTCDRCGKSEAPGDETCMFCQHRGEVELTLLFRGAIEFPGMLCATCYREFDNRGTIRGWYIREATG